MHCAGLDRRKEGRVWGQSKTWMGVDGLGDSTTGGDDRWGEHEANGTGVVGKSGGGANRAQ